MNLKQALICCITLVALLTLTTLAWQQEAPPIFRVTSTEVVIEFLAIDRDGRFVTDLDLKEIELKVDGKKHKIERLIAPRDQLSVQVVQPGDVPAASAGEGASGMAVSSGEIPRTVILLDTRVFDSSHFAHSVRAIRTFIDESLESNHQVMLAEIDRELNILSPFTLDRTALLAAVEELRPASVFNPLDPSRLQSDLGARYLEDLERQVGYLRRGLRLLCQSLSGLPGRKHVVFFSEGYPMRPIKDLEILARGGTAFASADQRQATSREVGSRRDPEVLPMVQEVVALANTFGVTFYTVDARGLVAVQGLGETSTRDQVAATGSPITEVTSAAVFNQSRISTLDEGQNTLVALAAGTNGSAFLNSNDLEAVLRASSRDQRYVYQLAFSPKSKGKPKFHRTEVTTERAGVVIRSQVGFQDLAEQELASLRLTAALERPDLFQFLQPLADFVPESGNRQLVIGIPGKQVSGLRNSDNFQIEVAFLGQVTDKDGKPLSEKPQIARGFRLNLTGEQFASLQQQPLLAQEELQLPAGQYKLILVALDQISGAMGAVEKSFTITR